MNKNIKKYIILLLSVIIILLLNVTKVNCPNVIGIFLLLINIYGIIKFKNNNKVFFMLIWIFYCNYSFLISKYLSSTPTFSSIWKQLKYSDTMMIGVSAITIFNIILLIFLLKSENMSINIVNEKTESNKIQINNNNRYELLLIAIILILLVVLSDYFIFNIISFSRQIYEYLLLFFVFGFYFAKESNKAIYKYILFLLMIFGTLANMIEGARVISLQPMIAYFFVFFDDKINYKKILVIFIIVVILFTFAGLYGDLLDSGKGMANLTIDYLIDTIVQRKFTLDTSIAAYWSGLTFIECSHFITFEYRLRNFLEYITSYLFLGSKSNYVQVYDFSKNYYLQYGGGYITSYFYYWLSWPGVILISCFVGRMLKMINNISYKKSELKKLLSIYIIATIPRWYLYYPTSLIRGILLFVTMYIIFKLFINKGKIKI